LDFSNNDNNMQFGKHLENYRKSKGIDLESLAKKSGIPVAHIKSIESGDFDRFDGFYLKLYLKRYALAFGETIEDFYIQAYGQKVEKSGEPLVVNRRQESQTTQNIKNVNKKRESYLPANKESIKRKTIDSSVAARRKAKFIRLLVVLSLVIIIAFSVFFIADLIRSIGNTAPTVDPIIDNPHDIIIDDDNNDEEFDNSLSEEDDDIEEEIEEEEPEPITEIERTEVTGASQTFNLTTNADELVLEFEFEWSCWMTAIIGYNTFMNEMFGPDQSGGAGETHTFTFDELDTDSGSISLSVGYIRSLAMTINGEEVNFDRSGSHQNIIINFERAD